LLLIAQFSNFGSLLIPEFSKFGTDPELLQLRSILDDPALHSSHSESAELFGMTFNEAPTSRGGAEETNWSLLFSFVLQMSVVPDDDWAVESEPLFEQTTKFLATVDLFVSLAPFWGLFFGSGGSFPVAK
jgi:hypothetical protein